MLEIWTQNMHMIELENMPTQVAMSMFSKHVSQSSNHPCHSHGRGYQHHPASAPADPATCVWMVSVVQDHAFPGQHLLQLGTRLGCLAVISRVPCARVICCMARQEGEDSFVIDHFSSNYSSKVFLGF